MSLRLVRTNPPQRVEISIPLDLWEKLVSLTPSEFGVDETIVYALTDFVEQEAVNTAGMG